MFSHPGMVENQENVVTITDIDVEVFEDLLHYIYTGLSRNLHRNALPLMIAADKVINWNFRVYMISEMVSSDRGSSFRPYQKLGGPRSWVANIATAA